MQTVIVKDIYTLFAELLDFPRENIRPKVEECIQDLFGSQYPEDVIKELVSFKNDLDRLSIDALQELYSYTFELVSDTTLDMGYYLHAGQDGFKRARNLVAIKAMYRDKGFPFEEVSKGELPDHLSVLLRFIGFIENEELRRDFMKTFVVVSMEKLHRNFQTKKNAYRHLINALYKIIDKDVKEEK
ncbi:MAG: molecular chaperone TorD family protein [Nitrospirae bacterium]|nr:molecular chaperone TorD family protein [Nitrospirota bacterium]